MLILPFLDKVSSSSLAIANSTRIYVFATFDILCLCLEHVPCSYEMDHVITLPLHLSTLKL